MLTGASITRAHGSVHGLAPVELFSENPVHIQCPQHYSSPVIQTHQHSVPSTIFNPGTSLGSDSYLVGDPGLSKFTQSESTLESIPVDEVNRLVFTKLLLNIHIQCEGLALLITNMS